MTRTGLEYLIGHRLVIEQREFTVSGASRREAEGAIPAFTLFEIRAAPALRIDLALPDTWNDNLYTIGNGGWAGEPVDSPLRDMPRGLGLARGFAVVGSNTGHDEAVDFGASFGSDREKLIDYAYRAIHHSVLVAQAMLTEIHGRRARYSYYEGCSTGGRQGLMAAQRYPEDFDGIIAGCPVLDLTSTQLAGVRIAQELEGKNVGAREMAIVAGVVNRKLGAREGRAVELIDDPLGADFDVLRDVPVADGDCIIENALARAQAEAIAKVYEPVAIGRGRSYPGMPIGGEAPGTGLPGTPDLSGWEGWMYPSDVGFFAGTSNGVKASFGETFLQGMLGHRGSWREFDFSDEALGAIEEISALVDAVDPDLGAFARAGGKLILYHGLSDMAVNPARTVAYFDSVRETMGEAVESFARFYAAPGMFHCFGGYGPHRFDMLTALTGWVERGEAPGTIIASHNPDPARPGKVWTRPLCPYPAIARYDGTGDPFSADSYRCELPDRPR